MDASALISAGASLLGGAFGKKANPGRDTRHVILNQVGTAREAGERFGFNPLTVLGATGGTVAPGGSDPNYMGNAIADAGMILADAWAKRTDAQKLQRSQERIKELQAKLDNQNLRPKVGGVYAQREMSPMLRPSNGGGNARLVAGAVPDNENRDRSHGSGDFELDSQLGQSEAPVSPGRIKQVDPVKNSPGFIEIDNRFTGGPIYAIGEDVEFSELALQSPILAPQIAGNWFNHGKHWAGNASGLSPSMRMEDGKRYALQPAKRPRPKMAGGKVASPKSSAGKLPFQP